MNKETIKTITKLASLGLLTQALFLAFSKQSRREIGHRDGWECQGIDDLCMLGRNGKPARFQDGYMVQASHFDHDRRNQDYNSPQNGEILCVAHHALDHLEKGELREAQAILNMGIYTYDAREKGINEEQIKLHVSELEDYIDSVLLRYLAVT